MNIDDLYPQPQIDHYFNIAGDQFHCSLEDEYSKKTIFHTGALGATLASE